MSRLLTICLVFFTLAGAVDENGAYDFITTLPILSEELHTSCQVHSGYNLTMIYCSDSFEVYDTSQLVNEHSLLTN